MSSNAIQVGEVFTQSFHIDKDDIRHFSRVTGINLPAHFNGEEAVKQGFKRLVAPPSMIESLVHSTIANRLGAPLTGRLLNCRLINLANAYHGDNVTVTATVGILTGIVYLVVKAVNQEGSSLLEGNVHFRLDQAFNREVLNDPPRGMKSSDFI